MAFIGCAALLHLHHNKKLDIHTVSLREVNTALKQASLDTRLKLTAIKDPCVDSDPHLLLSEHFDEFLHVFKKGKAQELPPHRSYNHSIPLKPDSAPPFSPLYGMSHEELLVLKEYIEENLAKRFIQHSSLPARTPVLFVEKADCWLRFCMDYYGLNEMTIKNRYPLTLIQETLARLHKARWHTKLDLRDGYYHLCITEGEGWKTADRTRYGYFQYLVMPFGLMNTAGSFQHFMNDTIGNFLDVFCTAFLDDILMYSSILKKNKEYGQLILE